MNCWVAPVGTVGLPGVTAIELSVGAGPGLQHHIHPVVGGVIRSGWGKCCSLRRRKRHSPPMIFVASLTGACNGELSTPTDEK